MFKLEQVDSARNLNTQEECPYCKEFHNVEVFSILKKRIIIDIYSIHYLICPEQSTRVFIGINGKYLLGVKPTLDKKKIKGPGVSIDEEK